MTKAIRNKQNPIVFFDISLGKSLIGRIKIQLYADFVPKSAENFRQFCTGQFKIKEKPAGYKNSRFYHIQNDQWIQGGDFLFNDGSGNISIYGQKFDNENFEIQHNEPGILSLVSQNSNENGCKFRFQLNGCQKLNKKSMVIGKVIDQQSMKILNLMITTKVNEKGKPIIPIIIQQCGQM